MKIKRQQICFFAAIFLALTFSLSAITPDFLGARPGVWTMDYYAAMNRAQAENRHVVVLFTGDRWCPHCLAQDSKVFTNPEWQQYVDDMGLLLVCLDNPKRDGSRFDAAGKPIVLLEDPDYLASVLNNEGYTITRDDIERVFATNALLQTQYTLPEYTRVGYPTCIIVAPNGDRLGRFSSSSSTVTLTQVLRRMAQIMEYSDENDDRDGSITFAKELVAPLEFDEEVTAGNFHLSEIDTADCYAFNISTNNAWRFSVSMGVDLTNNCGIKLEICNPSGTVLFKQSGDLLTGTELDFAPQQAGTYVLRVKTNGSITNAVAYTLKYSKMELKAYAYFPNLNIDVSESSAAINVNVAIRELVPQTSIKVRYYVEQPTKRAFGVAWPGEDFIIPPEGGFIEWSQDAARTSKIISIPIVKDEIWEGNETFDLFLEAIEGCEIIAEASCVRVTIIENTMRKPGEIGITHWGADPIPITTAKTQLPVKESGKLYLWLSRVSNSDGAVTAEVAVVQGSIPLPLSECTINNHPVVWQHGEMNSKKIELCFSERQGLNADRLLTAKITASSGAKLISGKTQAQIILRDAIQTQSLAEYLALNPQPPLKATTGAWFFSEDLDGLTCLPPTAGKTAVLQATVKGPGIFSFVWELTGASSGDGTGLTCKAGKIDLPALSADLSDANVDIVIPAGNQTIKWTLTRGKKADESNAIIRNLSWQPLSQAQVISPASGQSLMERDFDGLHWNVAGTSTFCSVFAGLNSKKLDPLAGEFETTVTPVDGLAQLIADAQAKPIYWRVDTVVRDSANREVSFAGTVNNFTVLPAGSPEFMDGEINVVDLGVFKTDIGLERAIGPFIIGSGMEGTIGCNATGLPTGMSLTINGNQVTITGVPKKTGTFNINLIPQLKRPNGSVMPGASAFLTLIVSPLPLQIVGAYNGGVDSDLYGSGQAVMNITAVGVISGKITADGKAYAFSGAFTDKAEAAGTYFYMYEGKAKYGSGKNLAEIPISIAVDAEGNVLCDLPEADDDAYFFLIRNSWKDAGMMQILNRFAGYYTVALPSILDDNLNGSGYLTITVGAAGSTKIAGVLADGSSLSLSTTLFYMPVADNEPEKGLIWLCNTKNGQTGICGMLEVVLGNAFPSLNTIEISQSHGKGLLRWWNYKPQSVPGYNPVFDADVPADQLGFIIELQAAGGFYSPTASLQDFYRDKSLYFGPMTVPPELVFTYSETDYNENNKKVTEKWFDAAWSTCYESALPLQLVVNAKGLAFTLPGDLKSQGKDEDGFPLYNYETALNPTALKFAFTQKTGIFTGKLSLYYDYESAMDWTANGGEGKATFTHKAVNANYKGVLTPIRPAGQPFEGQGFLLIPGLSVYENLAGKELTYKFNYSRPITIIAQ